MVESSYWRKRNDWKESCHLPTKICEHVRCGVPCADQCGGSRDYSRSSCFWQLPSCPAGSFSPPDAGKWLFAESLCHLSAVPRNCTFSGLLRESTLVSLRCSPRGQQQYPFILPTNTHRLLSRARFCARGWRHSGRKAHMALTLKEFTIWFRGREANKHLITQVINCTCVQCCGGKIRGAVRISYVLLLCLLSEAESWHCNTLIPRPKLMKREYNTLCHPHQRSWKINSWAQLEVLNRDRSGWGNSCGLDFHSTQAYLWSKPRLLSKLIHSRWLVAQQLKTLGFNNNNNSWYLLKAYFVQGTVFCFFTYLFTARHFKCSI